MAATWVMYVARFAPLVLLLLAGAAGCASGDLQDARTTSDQPRAGNVYIVRGLIGIWSLGMDDLADKLRGQGVRALVYQDTQTSDLARRLADTYHNASGAEPLILVGHSLGADDVVTIARHLEKADVPVDLLITIDPVSAGAVPANVRRAVNLYKSGGALNVLHIFRGVPLTAEKPAVTRLENVDLRATRHDLDPGGRIDHFNIDDSDAVQEEVVRQILKVTPRRTRPPATRSYGHAPD